MRKAYEIKLSKQKNNNFESIKIKNSIDIYDYAKQFYKDDLGIYESIFLMILDKSNHIIGWSKIGQGGTCYVAYDVKIIAKIAIDSLAESVILVHNHPSGNIEPSYQDKTMCTKIKSALDLLDIKLLDNLVISESSFYSFHDNGNL